jgi:hypothetical protein
MSYVRIPPFDCFASHRMEVEIVPYLNKRNKEFVRKEVIFRYQFWDVLIATK